MLAFLRFFFIAESIATFKSTIYKNWPIAPARCRSYCSLIFLSLFLSLLMPLIKCLSAYYWHCRRDGYCFLSLQSMNHTKLEFREIECYNNLFNFYRSIMSIAHMHVLKYELEENMLMLCFLTLIILSCAKVEPSLFLCLHQTFL